jgi:histidinol-phosphatase (PHP family)
MALFNFHTHNHYCDGYFAPVIYVEEAIRQGFTDLGFSSHSPLPFENSFAIKNDEELVVYADEIRALKLTYQDKINIHLGLEIDFIPGVTKPFNHFKTIAGLEYVIGGVHLINIKDHDDIWFIDGPRQETYDKGLKLLFGKDFQKAITAYWIQVREMISSQKPDIVAHLDKIKMHNKNRYFHEDESWYEAQLDDTLQLIKETETIVEVNTRGIYKGRSDELFPGIKALIKIHKLKIPITISSDAHRPEELSGFYPQTLEILKEIGFTELMIYSKSCWSELPIKTIKGRGISG